MTDDPREGKTGSAAITVLTALLLGAAALVVLWLPDRRGKPHDLVSLAIKASELILSSLVVAAAWPAVRAGRLSDLTRSWNGIFALVCLSLGALGLLLGAGVLLAAKLAF